MKRNRSRRWQSTEYRRRHTFSVTSSTISATGSITCNNPTEDVSNHEVQTNGVAEKEVKSYS